MISAFLSEQPPWIRAQIGSLQPFSMTDSAVNIFEECIWYVQIFFIKDVLRLDFFIILFIKNVLQELKGHKNNRIPLEQSFSQFLPPIGFQK